MRIDHLTDDQQRLLRLAVNRLGEKGQWNLDELKIEFEELILASAPIEITGFELQEIVRSSLTARGPSRAHWRNARRNRGRPSRRRVPIWRHRVVCGSATDPETFRRLMDGGELSRLILTDEPYNVKISGHVTGGAHREFAMASGEMSDAEFLAFNEGWMAAVLPYLCDGGVCGTFIDWRGYPTVFAAASKLRLIPLNWPAAGFVDRQLR